MTYSTGTSSRFSSALAWGGRLLCLLALALIALRPVTAPTPADLSQLAWQVHPERKTAVTGDQARAEAGGLKRCLQAKCPDFRPEADGTTEPEAPSFVVTLVPLQLHARADAPRETDVPPPRASVA